MSEIRFYVEQMMEQNPFIPRIRAMLKLFHMNKYALDLFKATIEYEILSKIKVEPFGLHLFDNDGNELVSLFITQSSITEFRHFRYNNEDIKSHILSQEFSEWKNISGINIKSRYGISQFYSYIGKDKLSLGGKEYNLKPDFEYFKKTPLAIQGTYTINAEIITFTHLETRFEDGDLKHNAISNSFSIFILGI